MTKTEFLEWKEHPVTEQMMKLFAEVLDTLKEDLVDGTTLGNEVQTAKKVGMVQGLNFFLNAEFDDNEH